MGGLRNPGPTGDRRGQLEPLKDLLSAVTTDGTIVDFYAKGVTQDKRDEYNSVIAKRVNSAYEASMVVYLREREAALREAGIGRTFFNYEIRKSWFPNAAQNFVPRLISRWHQRQDEGRLSRALFPNIVCTGDKYTGKSSFAVWACKQAYEMCCKQRNTELVPISIRWVTQGELCDLMRRGREDLSRYKRCELLVIDDCRSVTPDWVRKEFETLLMYRYYNGNSTIIISRLDIIARGPDDEQSLNEALPGSLEAMLDMRRGMGSAQFINDLEERAQTPSDQQEGMWWDD